MVFYIEKNNLNQGRILNINHKCIVKFKLVFCPADKLTAGSEYLDPFLISTAQGINISER